MSALTEPRRRAAIGFGGLAGEAPAQPPETVRRRRTRVRTRSSWTESLVIFGLGMGLLFALGYWTTIDLHVIYRDGESRLAHAYMAIWDQPAKLSTIGFVWPPLQTLALLPFAVIKPLATSLVAVPLFSSLCGALLLVVLNRTLRVLELGRGWRYALLGLFAANPLFLDYGSNGMAEIQYLLLLSLGTHYLISWYVGGAASYRKLGLSGVFMALAILTRYELAVWLGAMALLVGVSAWRRRRRWSDFEAPVLIFLAPGLYAVAVWSLISMQVIGGGPLSWLTRANNQAQGSALPHAHVLNIAADVCSVTARISPMLWIVPGGLLVLGLWRRDRFALWLGGFILVGAAVTFLLVLQRPATGLLQPRYNLRSLPAMVIGAGWLLRATRPGAPRAAVGALLTIGLIVSVPLVVDLDRTYPYQFNENAWVEGILTGRDQSDNTFADSLQNGVRRDRLVADWIDAHVVRPEQILVDDSAFPGVVLATGRPRLMLMRTYRGDRYFRSIVVHPWGRVRYLLVSDPFPIRIGADRHARQGNISPDITAGYWPNAYHGGIPGTRVVYRTLTDSVVWVDPEEPIDYYLADGIRGAFLRHPTVPRLRSTAPRSLRAL